jgi:ATP-dependent Lon protease
LVGEIRFQSNCCSATDLRTALAPAVDVRIAASEAMPNVSARGFEPTVLVALISASGAALGALLTGLLTLANQKRGGKLTVIGEEQAPMLEATQIAVAVLRATPESGLRLTDIDVHIHARATARDTDEALSWGPSLYMAMRSAVSGVPVPSDLSCIGRLTLLGEIAGVPHVPAKLAAAQRFGIRRVALAEENRVDADASPRRVTEELELHFVSDVDELNRFIAG